MKSLESQIKTLPDSPGVYYFLDKEKVVLYVGKATSLKERVRSYFLKDVILTRGPKILKMLDEAKEIAWKTTPSVLEALILEANEIKRLQPKANSRDKDDKSYYYVVITNEDFPKIILERGRNIYSKNKNEETEGDYKNIFGPFPHGGELREALKIIRKIFPFRDSKCKILNSKITRPCFNAQIGLCPGPCAGRISKEDYAKNIRNITLFFEGKKDKIIRDLEKEMNLYAKVKKFEKANEIKRKLFALDHIQDIALIKRDIILKNDGHESSFRIEAYDIAHLSGKEVVGVMTVVIDGELDKSQYRKFKIKSDKNDDVNNLKEILIRRFNHPEWTFPNLVVVDGGIQQLNMLSKIISDKNLNIPVVSVVKDEKHKAKNILGIPDGQHSVLAKQILMANSESHRFAINYHRKLRTKGFRI